MTAPTRHLSFQGAMARATLSGTKTKTRRPVRWRNLSPSLNMSFTGLSVHSYIPHFFTLESRTRIGIESRSDPTCCPHGTAGMQVAMREPWHAPALWDLSTADAIPQGQTLHYPATDGDLATGFGQLRAPGDMPAWASRADLTIVSVSVERLQAITEEEAIAEGTNEWIIDPTGFTALHGSKCWAVACDLCPDSGPFRTAYACLWESLYGAGSWGANPWVWNIEFKKVEP